MLTQSQDLGTGVELSIMPAGMDFDLETLLDDSLKILSQNVDTVSKASKMLVIIRKVTAK